MRNRAGGRRPQQIAMGVEAERDHRAGPIIVGAGLCDAEAGPLDGHRRGRRAEPFLDARKRFLQLSAADLQGDQ